MPFIYRRSELNRCYEKINSVVNGNSLREGCKLIPISDEYRQQIALQNVKTHVLPIQRSSDRTTELSIQVAPKQPISQFIDDICPKNPNTFKHSNPRIINKKQLQNYVSEYNNDRDFYEYLSSNSSTQL